MVNSAFKTYKMLGPLKWLVQYVNERANYVSICSFSYLFKIAGLVFVLISGEIMTA